MSSEASTPGNNHPDKKFLKRSTERITRLIKRLNLLSFDKPRLLQQEIHELGLLPDDLSGKPSISTMSEQERQELLRREEKRDNKKWQQIAEEMMGVAGPFGTKEEREQREQELERVNQEIAPVKNERESKHRRLLEIVKRLNEIQRIRPILENWFKISNITIYHPESEKKDYEIPNEIINLFPDIAYIAEEIISKIQLAEALSSDNREELMKQNDLEYDINMLRIKLRRLYGEKLWNLQGEKYELSQEEESLPGIIQGLEVKEIGLINERKRLESFMS